MATVYVLGNKKTLVTRMWGNQAKKIFTSHELHLSDKIIGNTPQEIMLAKMHLLQPGDIVIADGNKEGQDCIDEDLLFCLKQLKTENIHFVLLSADQERVDKFKEQIKENIGYTAFKTIYAGLTNQLIPLLKNDVKTALESTPLPSSQLISPLENDVEIALESSPLPSPTSSTDSSPVRPLKRSRETFEASHHPYAFFNQFSEDYAQKRAKSDLVDTSHIRAMCS